MSSLVLVVTFDKNNKIVSSMENQIVASCKTLLAKTQVSQLVLESYSSPAGDTERNSAIAVRRAEVVKTVISSIGYPAHKVFVRIRGERDFEHPQATVIGKASKRVEIVEVR